MHHTCQPSSALLLPNPILVTTCIRKRRARGVCDEQHALCDNACMRSQPKVQCQKRELMLSLSSAGCTCFWL